MDLDLSFSCWHFEIKFSVSGTVTLDILDEGKISSNVFLPTIFRKVVAGIVHVSSACRHPLESFVKKISLLSKLS
jgi:hypothetical protein